MAAGDSAKVRLSPLWQLQEPDQARKPMGVPGGEAPLGPPLASMRSARRCADLMATFSSGVCMSCKPSQPRQTQPDHDLRSATKKQPEQPLHSHRAAPAGKPNACWHILLPLQTCTPHNRHCSYEPPECAFQVRSVAEGISLVTPSLRPCQRAC